MKSLLSLRYLYKISSKRLANFEWDMTLSREEAIKHNELISLASSTTLRMIDKINGDIFTEDKVCELKEEIRQIKKMPLNQKNKQLMKEKQKELSNLLFMEDYLCVIMESKKDYDRAIKGFKVNGIEYVRLLATSGGVKKSTIVFVSKKVHQTLSKWIHNGRDVTKEFVPAKLEAYLSLACSASIPVSNPNGVLVVHDVETTFMDKVIVVDGLTGARPKVEEVDNYESSLNACDGLGLMMPSLAKRWGEEVEEEHLVAGVCLRNAFCKGMIFTFDFQEFGREVAKSNKVTDVWGQTHNINEIELVLTTSMLKLWDSYTSIEHYLKCCEENNHTFALTKVTPKELDNEQTMNYQFLQSLDLEDEDIIQLIKPTIDEIDDILNYDYRKSLLYLRGVDLKEKSIRRDVADYTKALMIDKNMLYDPYTHSKIRNNIKNRINQTKLGVINVRGNFSILSGDPYILCESIFNLEPKGLLKRGEIYSKYWIDRGVNEVAIFRAPMTIANNIRKMNIANNEEVNKWYQYMNVVTILNSWDNTCASLNGADFDGDTGMTTDNKYVMKGVKPTLPVLCMQGSSKKCVPTEKDFIKANKDSFGSAIGSITNKGTAMYDVLAKFEKGSREYEEVSYRLCCMQDYQQAEIDKSKGCLARPVPKEWYDWKINKIQPTDDVEIIKDKTFNQSILADKKPYFFIYNYDTLRKEYMKYEKSNDRVCLVYFDMTIKELMFKKNRTEREEQFIQGYKDNAPVSMTNSTMNKICWYIEEHFMNATLDYEIKNFNSDLLKNPNVSYSTILFNKVAKIKEKYDLSLQEAIKTRIKNSKGRIDSGEVAMAISAQMEIFKEETLNICSNADILCNILVDLCYKNSNKSKQFAWEICGEEMINNLLRHHNYKISFPTKDENGDFEFKGMKFKMEEITLCD